MVLQPPTIGQSPLDFGAIPQGESRAVQEVISNPTQQTLLWHADTSGTRWLYMNKSAGTLQPGDQEAVDVTIDTSSLAVGEYAATLTFISEGDDSSAYVQVPVTLNVSPAPDLPLAGKPGFAVSPLTVGVTFSQNLSSSQTLPLAITNRDSQNAMKWTADTGGTNWVTLDRSEGILQPHEQQTIYVTANTTNSLAYGDYTNTLTFTTEGAGTSSAVQLQADMHISPIPYGDSGPKAPIVSPTYLDFDTLQLPWNNPLLSFTNPASNGTVDWVMKNSGVSWVKLNNSVVPLRGTLQGGSTQPINVTINKTGLPAGPQQTDLSITFTFHDPAKASLEPTSRSVKVTMTVP